MSRELQIDIAELRKLKGIRIETTADHQPFLIFTYAKKRMSETLFAVVCWAAVVALYAVCGFVIWWYVSR